MGVRGLRCSSADFQHEAPAKDLSAWGLMHDASSMLRGMFSV